MQIFSPRQLQTLRDTVRSVRTSNLKTIKGKVSAPHYVPFWIKLTAETGLGIYEWKMVYLDYKADPKVWLDMPGEVTGTIALEANFKTSLPIDDKVYRAELVTVDEETGEPVYVFSPGGTIVDTIGLIASVSMVSANLWEYTINEADGDNGWFFKLKTGGLSEILARNFGEYGNTSSGQLANGEVASEMIVGETLMPLPVGRPVRLMLIQHCDEGGTLRWWIDATLITQYRCP